MPARTSSHDHAARRPQSQQPLPDAADVGLPGLDQQTLRAVRRAAAALSRQNGLGLPPDDVVRVAADVTVPMSIIAHPPGEPVVVVVRAASLSPRPGTHAVFDPLTPREREVAAMVADGLSNVEISQALVVSVATVKDHVHRILVKTGLPRRAAISSFWHR